MSPLRYALVGKNGRMGQSFLKVENAMDAVCAFGIGRDFDLEGWGEAKPQVIIDFSLATALPRVVEMAKEKKLPLVSGVTGISEEQKDMLRRLGQSVPVFWSPNMSIGVAIMKQMLSSLAIDKSYDFHLHESHHKMKLDRPSGTALYLAKKVEDVTEKACPISDSRGGAVFGFHEMRAMGGDDEIVVSHRAYNRDIFAKGALRIAREILTKKPAFYQMDDFLGDLSK